MKFITTKGLIIKKQNFGESDKLITVFSEKFGKINLLVKGIRKSKKRNQSYVDILTLSNFTFYKKNDNYILTGIDSLDLFIELKTDIERLEISLYILSIINETIFPEDRKVEFFKRVIKTIYFIIKNDNYKNYILVLKMMSWIIKKEGYAINIFGKTYFNILKSEITDIKYDAGEKLLNSKLYEVILKIETNGSIERKSIDLEFLIKAITLYEDYMNYHLDTKLNIKKHLFGGFSC